MKSIKAIIALAVLVAIGAGLYFYWEHGRLHPSTEDAYVSANIITVAAEIPGRVIAVNVVENQMVTAGEILFTLDPRNYQDAVDSAQAQVRTASEAAGSYAAQVQAASSAVSSAQSALDVSQSQLDRTQSLFDQGDVARTTLDQAQSGNIQAQAAVNGATAQLSAARTAMVANRQGLSMADAALNTAQTNLDRATVAAPADGIVANITLREGTTVGAYAPLFSIVETSDWWIEANFKETDLPRIRAGQPATVEVDMLPGVEMIGHVESIGPGSGATFALLPAENASGNWVKVTQRFAVRVALDAPPEGLRAGASAAVTVDTTTDAAPQ